jgi:hypothetical protein
MSSKRHGNHHPLPHAAGHLVRILLDPRLRIGNADHGEQFNRPLFRRGFAQPLVLDQPFHDLHPDRHRRVQGCHRVLEDHADLVAAHFLHLFLGKCRQILAFEQNGPFLDSSRRCGNEAHDRLRGDAFAGAGLPDDRDRFPFFHLKVDTPHRLHFSAVHLE